MATTVILRALEGPLKGQEFVFERHDTFLFGRSPDCHGRLDASDQHASRHHFILEINPPALRLRDLGSLNGTFVNQVKHGSRASDLRPEQAAREQIPYVDLKAGDRISVGDTVFQVDVRQPPAPPVPCSGCGKPGPPGQGDYLCSACRAVFQPDELLQQLVRGGGQAGPVGGYELMATLGKGGMGAVYLVRRQSDRKTAAVKIMLAEVAVRPDSRDKFLREMKAMEKLDHPNCVRLFGSGGSGSAFYMLMEYCPGGGLDGLIQRRGGILGEKEAISIMSGALAGLAHAHQRGLVHRDLKPQNILLTDPQGGQAKVADFGFAKNFQEAGLSGMTATGNVGGTIGFMPREQIINFKYVEPSTDVWAMGATFYSLLTGMFTRDFPRGVDPLMVILQKPCVPIRQRKPSVSPWLAELIDRSLSDDLSYRFKDAGQFHQALLAGAR